VTSPGTTWFHLLVEFTDAKFMRPSYLVQHKFATCAAAWAAIQAWANGRPLWP
jgi:hypothetical protein